MISSGTISAIRFGYGLGPRTDGPVRAALLDWVAQPDNMMLAFPVAPTPEAIKLAGALAAARKNSGAGSDTARNSLENARRDLQRTAGLGLVHGIARILESRTPLRERLVWFWADHFTAVPRSLPARAAAPAYIDEAIRPHVGGTFAGMLKAAVTHPLMLTYLDQASSTGPNSPLGKRRGKGLNENLAREVLELHTLGVGAGYSQDDVRQLAELMTGMTFARGRGFVFNPRMAEPGAETILGKRYGGKGRASLEDVLAALDDLALRPETARHIARKLAVHFVSDSPDPALVDRLAAAYVASGSSLPEVYAAMLDHPAAWDTPFVKAKQPFDFIASALVAFGLDADALLELKPRELMQLLFRPLADMGQPFMQARGPDGWPEAAEAWITPQGLASRIAWATDVAGRVAGRIEDPAAFLQRTLADAAGERLAWAVSQAGSAQDGIALVLASAEFNRR